MSYLLLQKYGDHDGHAFWIPLQVRVIAEISLFLNVKVTVLVSLEGLIRCPQDVAGELH